ncbi:MAG TPA: hypothetical protein VFE43_09570 [Candidatus Binataceae bacterium]|nr:hypothetical protein [Candidatus Binataceae bacterium]
MNRITLATVSVCAALLMLSCKSAGTASAKIHDSNAAPVTGKQWRLAKEVIAADSKEDYVAGVEALRTLDAFGTMEVSRLFYHHNLMMVPAGTLVAEAGPSEKGATKATKVRVLDGPQSGKTLWLYPESAAKMGFTAPTPAP